MFKLALRNLREHKRRLFTSGFAIVLGISFLCGSFIFTDTLKGLFTDLFTSATKGVDTLVRSERAFNENGDNPYDEGRALIPIEYQNKIRTIDGVMAVEPYFQGYAQVINKKGKLVRTGGAPTFGGIWAEDPKLSSYKLFSGHKPVGDNDVVLDRGLIKATGYKVGDKVRINTSGPVTEFTIVGDATFGSSDSALGATAVFFSPQRATALMGKQGQVQGFLVRAKPGVIQAQLTKSVREGLASMNSVNGSKLEVLTGKAYEKEQTALVNSVFNFISIFFTAFAFIALFVSIFVIANSFSIVIAQRNREMAMLRAIGASRKQVVGATFTEALGVGIIASVIGILAGIVIAWAIRAGLNTFFGGGLPSSGFKLLPRTVVVGMLVGTLVTIFSAVFPALRASRVKPLAALQATAIDRSATSKVRLAFGILFLVASVAAFAAAMTIKGTKGAEFLGFSAFAFLVCTAILGPLVARPVSSALGRSWYGAVVCVFGAIFAIGGIAIPFAAFRQKKPLFVLLLPLLLLAAWNLVKTGIASFNVSGQIARQNSVRNPNRTSATALALTIGTSVVSAIFVLSQSLTGTFRGNLEKSVKADFLVVSGTDFGFPREVADRIRDVPGHRASSQVRVTRGLYELKPRNVGIVDASSIQEVLDLGNIQGDISALQKLGTIAIDKKSADKNKIKLGDQLDFRFVKGTQVKLKVVAIYDNAEGLFNTYYLIGDQQGDQVDPSEISNFIYVRTDGKSPKSFQAAADKALTDFPGAEVKPKNKWADEQVGQLNQFLKVINALLALAIIIAILGIANTLQLSIYERTREVGLLRAVGQSRDQVRSMIRWEAIVVASFGTVLGILIGTGFGAALVKVLSKDGAIKVALPTQQILTLAVMAALVGLYAARKPAKQAAKMNILKAIATE